MNPIVELNVEVPFRKTFNVQREGDYGKELFAGLRLPLLALVLLSRSAMKKFASKLAIFGVVLVLAGATASGDDEQQQKKGVPPGLQKKGGLPPGQAKKQGNQTPSTSPTVQAKEVPKTATPSTPATPTTPTTPTTPATPATPVASTPAPTTTAPSAPNEPGAKVSREVQARRAKVESQVAELDSFGNTPEARERVFTRLHKNSNIPLSSLEAQRKAYPDVGLGGLTVANYITKGNSKVTAQQVLAEHKATGKGWGELAQSHGVKLTDLIDWMAEANASAKQAGTAGRLKGL